MTTTVRRPNCTTCYFYIPVGQDVGECREDSPKAGSPALSPAVPAKYWCGKFTLPPQTSLYRTETP